ncbi:N-6 DNA methylase [Sulfurimonas denitrificans DSM 1251]|uniref:site-specific DNA-methyltransferase (adenine-specific) n=1 Tax=Sulfurimonas denitrificans (strain ATCC 33889 / DSM 1251) TaxID=326298 RepID=Q30Q60_SULDN|nr:N-6 DNA methylase [Sulfurimonas denitrificans]ABB43976.1 N-6 DNA methylase [Sulfurimonas denitrificans DSM 1251]ABB44871.1 N-6 DNA methylase [Sulfurimonas denitrificans DSM 1251]
MTMIPNRAKILEKSLCDYYWAYSDILRDIGINESTYDQRIMAFMALKLLIDNDKLMFTFEYNNNFGLDHAIFAKYDLGETKKTFLNIIKNIEKLGQNLNYFTQESKYNPDTSKNILTYLNHFKTFELERYIQELPNNYLENVLDIYTYKANFRDYPKEQYKDLYEATISRMKKLSGDLTGQHFTQKSIVHLMCEVSKFEAEGYDKLAIYDPTCGTASMLMESAHYFYNKNKIENIEVYGQELHGQTWLLAKIFLEISSLDGKSQGIKNTIAYGNTLTNPAFANGINGDTSFDFIIANPPFGVDWKHNYDEIVQNMSSKKSDFFVVKDEKNKVVTPKKSDGQFLFMQHIINLMKSEKRRNKHAHAAIISSSTLISTGNATSSESKIRKEIFNTGFVSAVLEQPSAMFTNTDISSHIWFLDSDPSEKITIVKADTKEEELFSPHLQAKDKMKNSYSQKNIRRLATLINSKKEFKYKSKFIDSKDRYEINISNEIGFKDEVEDLNFDELTNELNMLMKEMCEEFQNSSLFGIK